MSGDEAATRRELDALAARLNSMDEHGTRGIAPLAVQLTQVIKDMAALRSDVDHRFDSHEKQHDREEQRRVNGRRVNIGLFIAAVTAIDGPLVTLLLSRGR